MLDSKCPVMRVASSGASPPRFLSLLHRHSLLFFCFARWWVRGIELRGALEGGALLTASTITISTVRETLDPFGRWWGVQENARILKRHMYSVGVK